MKVLSAILILITVYSASAQFAGFGDWLSQSVGNFGKAWEELGDTLRNLSDNITSMTADLLWFKGPNVCKTEENRTDPFTDELQDFLGINYNGENCREKDFKFVCSVRVSENGATRQRVTTYECCPGYVGSNKDGKKCAKAT